MAVLQPLVLDYLHGGRGRGGVSPFRGALVAQNPPPLYRVSNRKHHSSSSSSRLVPTLAGLHWHEGTTRRRGGSFAVDRRRSLPPLLFCFSNGGDGRTDDKGVADEDADIEELLARAQRKLVIDVHPVQEKRREEEEAVGKGREMLFRQFCLHLSLTPQDLRAMWWARGGGRGDGGGTEERLQLVRDFLEEEWGWRYRPLSSRAAVEMLDEHMGSLDERAAAAAAKHPPATIKSNPAAAAPHRRLLPNWWW